MELKDMTNKELIAQHAEFSGLSERSGSDMKVNAALANCYACADELLRRLNEADALRKENRMLREDNMAAAKDTKRIEWLDDFYGNEDWSLNREIDGPFNTTTNGVLKWCINENSMMVGYGRTLRSAIDSALAKESEADHE